MTMPTHTCPPIEDIAALLDGRLEKQERLRVLQHLDECPECYEIFAGAAQFMEEDSAAEKPLEDWEDLATALRGGVVRQPQQEWAALKGRVVKFPLGGSTAVLHWLPLVAAAVLALAIGLPLYRAFVAPPRIESTDVLLRALDGDPKLQESLWTLTTNRGGDDEGNVTDLPKLRANSFMAGVLLVDWRVSLGASDPETAAALSQRLYLVLDEARMTDVAADFMADWQSEQKAQKPGQRQGLLQSMRDKAPSREAHLSGKETGLNESFFAFGKWAEAARLAAANESSEFFEERDIRRFPSYFLNADFLKEEEQDSREEEQEFDATVRQKLQRIEKILDSRDLQNKDFTKLAELLGEGGDEGPGLIKLFEDEAANPGNSSGSGEDEDGLGEGH